MLVAIDDERPAIPGKDFRSDYVDRVRVAVHAVLEVVAGAHLAPVNWRIAEEHSDLQFRRAPGIHGANGAKELFVDRQVPGFFNLRRVLPDVSKFFVGDGATGDEAIDERLIARVAELDDDVVEDALEPPILYESHAKRMALGVAVVIADGDERVRAERLDNR